MVRTAARSRCHVIYFKHPKREVSLAARTVSLLRATENIVMRPVVLGSVYVRSFGNVCPAPSLDDRRITSAASRARSEVYTLLSLKTMLSIEGATWDPPGG